MFRDHDCEKTESATRDNFQAFICKSLIEIYSSYKNPPCYKDPQNTSCIYQMIANRIKAFPTSDRSIQSFAITIDLIFLMP